MALDGKQHPSVYQKLSDVQGTPTMFFVNKNGNIEKQYDGKRDSSSMLKFICSQISSDSSGLCLV